MVEHHLCTHIVISVLFTFVRNLNAPIFALDFARFLFGINGRSGFF